ncbi:hypothetical protein WQQ_12480 [Hydrocarboniphaga effusa AP103]|uniref:Uncharacterized protein n=1 Tax=Hydrocarboniphaga effusa AP103 TaxID=1172194 RepID=I8I4G9_9GAMM|nr:hypothetical protein WQQ_12480 [Hydrocarboniphaga effusa AP103]
MPTRGLTATIGGGSAGGVTGSGWLAQALNSKAASRMKRRR